MTTELEQATKTLNDLLDQRDQLTGRSAKLAADRQAIAYAAHTGNKEAKDRLRKINDETVFHNVELESVDAAIAEANARLEAARQVEAQTADREQATQLRAALDEFIETGHEIDAAFIDLIAHASNLQGILDRIHQLGCPVPSTQQLKVLGEISARTALMKTPWARAVELVPPLQRRDFKSIIDDWATQIEQNINTRLQKQEVAA